MFALGPKTETSARRGPPGAAGALICGSAADFFDEQSVDTAPRIESGDARQAGVDHDLDAINRKRRLRDIRGHDRAALLVMGQRRVLFGGPQLAVERKNDELIADAGSAD